MRRLIEVAKGTAESVSGAAEQSTSRVNLLLVSSGIDLQSPGHASCQMVNGINRKIL